MIQKEQIEKAVAVLKAGGVILYPTDTIWGIGCDATNEAAVEKVFALKQRSDSKSLIILAGDMNMVGRYVREIPEMAVTVESLSDKPLTIIYPEGINLASNVFQRASIVLSCSALSASPSSPHRPMSQAHPLRRDTLISPMTSRPQWTSPLILPASRTPPARHLPSSSSACTTKYRSSGNSLSRPDNRFDNRFAQKIFVFSKNYIPLRSDSTELWCNGSTTDLMAR